MSARIRLTAKTAVSATAITATRIVIGRRRAARISHIGQRAPADEVSSEINGVERAVRGRLRQQRAPHVDARELVLHFRLREQTLRIGHFDDAREPGLIARARLRFALLRRRELDGRIGRDGARGLHHRGRRLLLTGDGQDRLVVQAPSRHALMRAAAALRARRLVKSKAFGNTTCTPAAQLARSRPRPEKPPSSCPFGFAPLPRANTLD